LRGKKIHPPTGILQKNHLAAKKKKGGDVLKREKESSWIIFLGGKHGLWGSLPGWASPAKRKAVYLLSWQGLWCKRIRLVVSEFFIKSVRPSIEYFFEKKRGRGSKKKKSNFQDYLKRGNFTGFHHWPARPVI